MNIIPAAPIIDAGYANGSKLESCIFFRMLIRSLKNFFVTVTLKNSGAGIWAMFNLRINLPLKCSPNRNQTLSLSGVPIYASETLPANKS